MKRLVVLFEDHSVQHLRPLAWSQPAHEIPCGLFNLRERLCQVLEGGASGLLVRSLLDELQSASRPDAPVGPTAVLAALETCDEVLLLSSRLALDITALRSLLVDLPADRPLGDGHGLLAWRTSVATARDVVSGWRTWEAEAAGAGAWTRDGVLAEPWWPVVPETQSAPAAWKFLWELVPTIGHAIVADLAALQDGGTVLMPDRTVFGALDDDGAPVRLPGGPLHRVEPREYPGVQAVADGPVWAADDVSLAPGVVLDASQGPIVLEAGVHVLPNVYLEGPLHLGPGVRVKVGAQLYGETAVGAASRVNGEIAESQICAFANKQHAGFLGHAVLGSWTNLGADTTNSDLKNNYGEISVNYGLGAVPTGSRFVGLMMAEHAKSAIGTTFNTGATVGFSANVFGAGFPRTWLRNYTWGDGRGRRLYQAERAIEVARVVMSRRGCGFLEAHAALFRNLSQPGE